MKNHLNYHRNFDSNAITSLMAIRACSRWMPRVSVTAYNLSRYLATWFNSSNANGIVNPSEKRICSALGISAEALHMAARELDSADWWKPMFTKLDGSNQTQIESYKHLFTERLTSQDENHLKSIRSSLNHSKVDSRYFRPNNEVAKALTAFAVESIAPHFNDLGHDYFMNSGQRHLINFLPNHGGKKKMVHSVMFDHPMLREPDPKIWAALARTQRLPEAWTANSYSCKFTLAELWERIDINPAEFPAAVAAIRDTGFWKIVIEHDPFADREFTENTAITMTPQYAFHQLVWELDLNEGGQQTTKWENEKGFGDNTARDLPPLGYHFVYAVKTRLDGKVLFVGQTTQALITRLNQHQRQGTNDDANAAIKLALESPDESLEIVHLATVHHSRTNEYEMNTVDNLLVSGHPLQNKILDFARNASTIHPDSRFGGLADYGRENDLGTELERCRTRNDGKEVLWERTLSL